ncbi:MAG: hypothetical protein Rubg2KO_05230 [Rubricoccaceae bacterium]
MASIPTTLLLVSAKGDVQGDTVRRTLPQLDVTVATSDTAARAYLGASAFDVVAVSEAMPDAIASTLESLIASLGRTSRVMAGAPEDGLVEWLDDRLSLETARDARAVASSTLEQDDALAFVSAELSRIAHALNNPLAVIDGNAQLALELSKALGVDASVISAIEDIQGGSQTLAALFSDIAALREHLDRLG